MLPAPPPNLGLWLEVISAVGGIAGAIGAVVIWLAKTSLVTRRDLADALAPLGEQNDEADRRLVKIETELQHMPTQRDFATLSGQVGDLKSELGRLAVAVEGFRDTLVRIERPLNTLVDAKLKEGS